MNNMVALRDMSLQRGLYSFGGKLAMPQYDRPNILVENDDRDDANQIFR